MNLHDRVAIVTGGSRGIGRAIALQLAEAGASVAVNYRSRRDEADKVVADIVGSGGRAVAIEADVAEYDQALHLVHRTIDELGGLHVVVNNAGITRDGLLCQMEPADWIEVMKVNFGGVFNCIRAASDHLMRQGQGSIVNVSSVMGERAWIGESNYAASKGAVNALTRCAALELARFGIRVNAVLAGFTVTEMVQSLIERNGRTLRQQIPIRRFAEAEQIGRAVLFLASDASDYMTGSLVSVDGGASSTLGLGH
jgi:3-oxoacyl-[acyl-carrier protein] reductase